jgi:predicted Rossmann fold flavoprotein
VVAVSPKGSSFVIKTSAGLLEADHVVCCSGGHNKKEAYAFIRNLGHSIVSPVPSLFTFNMPEEPVRKLLQGLSVEYAEVSVPGSRLSYSGPVLITHWGLSGPAVLKLSAFGAHHFFESGYLSTILINWCAPTRQEEALDQLLALQKERARALPFNTPSFGIPRRLWEFLCLQAGIDNSKPWAETAKKELHRLSEKLCRSQLKMQGKTTFKEEFVSCGGGELKEIDFKTMESKIVPGIYFAGEVLNIDGITGGFNFQNAWSTAWICGQSIAAKLKEKEEG